ncbi:hypothetical protein, partial [Victivallis lenta]|uniref:hypothetical protein n=1 Tax=Victivallis lenta TaxID=2606640 RepID=UPI003AB41CE4
ILYSISPKSQGNTSGNRYTVKKTPGNLEKIRNHIIITDVEARQCGKKRKYPFFIMHLSIVRTADEDSPPEKQQNNITAGNRRFSIRESRRRDCVPPPDAGRAVRRSS